MQVKQRHSQTALARVFSWLGRSRLVGLLVFFGFSVFMFGLGAYYRDKGSLYGAKDILEQNYRVPINYLGGLLSRPPHLFIDIKHKDYQRLAYNRQVALKRGRLLPDVRDEVSASLRSDNGTLKARIRLKGDLSGHWEDEKKWSFRIKIRGDQTLFGMKEFSIQDPRTRSFLNEWFLHRFLAFNDLIGLRYDFIEVTVNGRNLGIYAIEEHLDKRLVENNRLREGPLFRANTAFYWYHKPGLANNIYGTGLEAYGSKQLTEDAARADQWDTARSLFEAFRRGQLPAHQVFDSKKLATLLAILDLTGHTHASSLDNLSFYWNPVTSKIEPVARDNQAIRSATSLLGANKRLTRGEPVAPQAQSGWPEALFSDPVFFKTYIGELERISSQQLLDDFFEQHEQEYRQKLRILHRSSPGTRLSPVKTILYRNQQFIRDFLTPVRSVQAYFRGYSELERTLELEVASIHALPLEILNLSFEDSVTMDPTGDAVLQPYDSGPVQFRRVRFLLPPDVKWDPKMVTGLRLHQAIVGAATSSQQLVYPWPHQNPDFLEIDFIRSAPNFESFDFVRVDRANKLVSFVPGRWELERSLVIAPGYRVVAGPGTRLNFSNGAMLLSYSPLDFRGTDEEPVVIQSADSTGQGIVVLNAGGRSRLEHVHFSGLSNPKQGAWELTGAVTFYQSPVSLDNCRFTANRSEDTLNLIRGEFLIENSIFEQSSFDALDLDFSQGRIERTSFVDSGNDGIDMSGTKLDLQDILINGVGDKGLSAGEFSHLTGFGITIRNAEVAVASKDLSEIVLDNVTVENSRLAFTTYQKKPEFGPARLSATGVRLQDVATPYLIETNSDVSVNGMVIVGTRQKIEELMYGAEFGKSSN